MLGAPGTGKTTVGHILDKINRLKHYSNGEELRKQASQQRLDPEIAKYMNEGQPIPATLLIPEVNKIIGNYIQNGLYDPDHDILLLDGIPRNEEQLIEIKKYFDIYKVFIFFVKDDTLALHRIKSKRSEKRLDDADEQIIKKRKDVVYKELDSILSHFEKKQIVNIDSENNTLDQMVTLVKMNI